MSSENLNEAIVWMSCTRLSCTCLSFTRLSCSSNSRASVLSVVWSVQWKTVSTVFLLHNTVNVNTTHWTRSNIITFIWMLTFKSCTHTMNKAYHWFSDAAYFCIVLKYKCIHKDTFNENEKNNNTKTQIHSQVLKPSVRS